MPSSASQIATDLPEHNQDYVGGRPVLHHMEYLRRKHPFLIDMIQPDVVAGIGVEDYVAQMNQDSWEFEDAGDGGRGSEYNVAQQNIENRSIGIAKLLSLFSPGQDRIPDRDTVIVDALAGDGTISRLVDRWDKGGPTIICADLSRYMIEGCVEQGFPCIRQAASHSLLDDNVVDGVLIAYGSHHLTAPDRIKASEEAYRSLKPGGRFVLHDFVSGGPVDDWFGKVVHPYSRTGHPHPHFSNDEMLRLLGDAGFDMIEVFEMDDPFVVAAATPEEARLKMLKHLHAMYGLVKLELKTPEDYDALEEKVSRTLGDISIARVGDAFSATVLRQALVAVGTK